MEKKVISDELRRRGVKRRGGGGKGKRDRIKNKVKGVQRVLKGSEGKGARGNTG